MELSILTSKMIALIYISAGIAALTGKLDFNKIMEDFEKSPALTFMTGFVTLILGMILVTYHNRWTNDWSVLITVIGWAALFKGLMFLAFPRFFSFFKGWYKNTRLWGIILIVLGSVFGYWGFLA